MNNYYKTITLGATVLCLGAGNALAATPTLATGHADIGIVYEEGGWNLHVHQEMEDPAAGIEYAPGDVVLQVGAAARTVVPSTPGFQFLGPSLSPVYILPQVHQPGLLFLGLGTEEIPDGLFSNNQLTLSLQNVSGPGNFFLYTVDGFGVPHVAMNSADGISTVDGVTLQTGSHGHYNFAFTAAGTYEIAFSASGVLADGGASVGSDAATYTFEVIPEPGTMFLCALGLGALAIRRLKR